MKQHAQYSTKKDIFSLRSLSHGLKSGMSYRITVVMLLSFFLCCTGTLFAESNSVSATTTVTVVKEDTVQTADTLGITASAGITPALQTNAQAPLLLTITDSTVAKTLAQHTLSLEKLGDFHKIMGMYTTVTGVVAILGGVLLLDRNGGMPFAISFLTLGGVALGVGIWEIKIGAEMFPSHK